MSAIGGKADMPFALHMSAFDPKRTLVQQLLDALIAVRWRDVFEELAGSAHFACRSLHVPAGPDFLVARAI